MRHSYTITATRDGRVVGGFAVVAESDAKALSEGKQKAPALFPGTVEVFVLRNDRMFRTQDQRSLTDQLNDLERLAVEHGLYDAHDWVKERR